MINVVKTHCLGVDFYSKVLGRKGAHEVNSSDYESEVNKIYLHILELVKENDVQPAIFNNKLSRVLITGAGFVGRHLVKRSLEEGFEVDCVDPIIPLTGGLELDKWFDLDPIEISAFNFYKVDCREFFLANMSEKYDIVFHAAAMVGGRLMIEDFPLSVADDLSIDSHFWQWAASSKPDNSICFSSSAAYPINLQTYDNYRLLKEDDIDLSGDIGMPDLSYGWAKLTHEYLSKLAYEKHGIKSVIFRPFSDMEKIRSKLSFSQHL